MAITDEYRWGGGGGEQSSSFMSRGYWLINPTLKVAALAEKCFVGGAAHPSKRILVLLGYKSGFLYMLGSQCLSFV